MSDLMLEVGIVLCGIQAIRAARLQFSVLWLGCTSAFLAILLYTLGAYELAVIELSIGAGLITVLLVFVLNLTGERTIIQQVVLPKPIVLVMVGIIVILLAWYIFPLPAEKPSILSETLSASLWQDRSLDILMQIVLIFAGVLSVLGLLAESRQPVEEAAQKESLAEPEEIIQEAEEEYA